MRGWDKHLKFAQFANHNSGQERVQEMPMFLTMADIQCLRRQVHVYVAFFQIQDHFDLALQRTPDAIALLQAAGRPALGQRRPVCYASLFRQQASVACLCNACLCNASCLPSAMLLHSLDSFSQTVRQQFCYAVISAASML
ncbi:hypothetical protein ABBQ38_001450 [Trebouxia sp. C0009 RCD-2024]